MTDRTDYELLTSKHIKKHNYKIVFLLENIENDSLARAKIMKKNPGWSVRVHSTHKEETVGTKTTTRNIKESEEKQKSINRVSFFFII